MITKHMFQFHNGTIKPHIKYSKKISNNKQVIQ